VPKRIADDDETPRRRRGAKAAAVEAEAERGLLMRALLHSPKDMVAGALAVAAIGAIVTNALFLQSGPHPSPMFGSVVTLPAPGSPSTVNPLPRPRPAEAIRSEAIPVEPKAVESKAIEPRATDAKASDLKASDLRATDPLTNLVKATSTAPTAASVAPAPTSVAPATTSVAPVSTSAIPRPPASIPAAANPGPGGARRVAAVQRALTEYGYGQLKPTGTIGPDTQAAIAKFERDRKIPATGQMTDRMVRELSAMIGHTID
jgi:Putative peptidoglycan binding domain